MPWTPDQFKSRHNKGLSGSKAKKAASIANAMLKAGVPEGESIATANARAEGKPRTYQGNGKSGSGAKARTGKTRSWTGK